MKPIFNKLTDTATILAADHSTVVLADIAVGFEELSGRPLELAQLHSSQTTTRFTVRWNPLILSNCFVSFEGALYPIDWTQDPGVPNPDPAKGQVTRGILMEVYAHRIQDGVSPGAIPAGAIFAQELNGAKVHIRLNPILSTALPSSPLTDEVFYLTDLDKVTVWDGTKWVIIGGFAGVTRLDVDYTIQLGDSGKCFSLTTPGVTLTFPISTDATEYVYVVNNAGADVTVDTLDVDNGFYPSIGVSFTIAAGEGVLILSGIGDTSNLGWLVLGKRAAQLPVVRGVEYVNANRTITTDDMGLVFMVNFGDRRFDLPPVASVPEGFYFWVQVGLGNSANIKPNGTEQIQGLLDINNPTIYKNTGGLIVASPSQLDWEFIGYSAAPGASQAYVDAAVNAEAATRAAADAVLASAVITETAARSSADTTLQTNITAETSARTAADTTLQNNINAEASTRATADTTLQTNITAEASARAAADALLVPKTRTISTTAPVTGGGDLSADRTIAVSDFTGDAGSGGTRGTVPAPAAGDAAAKKVLKAGGTWGAIAESDVTNLVSDLAAKAPLASPALTGTPTVPTAAVDTSTTQAASTDFVLKQLSASGDGTPAMDGTAARGTSTHGARADHVHPTDTSRQASLGFTAENAANKDANSGYAGLTSGGLLKAAEFPTPTTSTFGGIKDIAAVATKVVNAITNGVAQLVQLAFSDISGTIAGSQLPTPTTTVFGGVKDVAAVTNNFVTSIVNGVAQLAQVAFSNISGLLNLVTQVTGVLPTANGGFLQQATGAVGQYVMIPTEVVGTTSAQMDGTANKCRFCMFTLKEQVTITNMVINVPTTSNGNTLAIGIYNAAHNSLLGQWTFALTAATGAYSVAKAGGGTLVLTPGEYTLVWACDATTPLVSGISTDGTPWSNVWNKNFTRMGQGAGGSPMSGGVLPASLGTVVAAAIRTPQVLLEP